MEEQTTTPENNSVQKSKFNPMFIVGAVIVIAIVGFVGTKVVKHLTRASQPVAQQTQQQKVQPTSAVAGAETTTAAEKTFTVTGGNFYFKPNQITVKKGDKVKITFTNSGGFHDFVLNDFNVKTARLKDGESASVEFTADKTGTFEYYCSVGEHKAMGMKGTLTVE